MTSYIEKYSRLIKDPFDAQKFLHSLKYNSEERGETLRSANEALKRQTSHCLEACFISAALLEKRGYPPLVLSLESIDNLDHVVFLFQKNNRWGSIGHSRDEGLHGRKAIFKTPKDVAKSYIDEYVDLSGRITAYAVANLNNCKADWRYSKRNVWSVEKYLIDFPHKKINCRDSHYEKLYQRFASGKSPAPKTYWI